MKKSLVGIIMGSDSDLVVMKEARDVLVEFKVSHDLEIVSAHRTTRAMFDYAMNAKQKGFEVIIAGAGGAAHLPGMVASLTTLPVIGIPIRTKSMDGLDSLLSIAQMPPGVPVATVGINGAKNAGILACQILAVSHPEIARKVAKYKERMESSILRKADTLQKVGVDKYLKMMRVNKQ